MTYPNAYKGIKKVFTAQILMLIVAILVFIAACVGVVGIQASNYNAGNEGVLVVVGGIGVVIGILSIISFIINLVGLAQAGKDEGYFKGAFILTIIGLVVSIINGAYTSSHPGSNGIFQVATNVIQLLIIISVISGVMVLATKLNDIKLQKRAKSLSVIITIILIIALVLNIIVAFVGNNMATGVAVTFAVMGLLAAVLGIIAYIMYLALLGRAKKSFQQ